MQKLLSYGLSYFALLVIIVITIVIFSMPGNAMKKGDNLMNNKPENYPSATLGGGCFWCLESEFRALDGILHTRVGYAGGEQQSPSYRDVTTGNSGHAEVVEITYDPELISYADLLQFFLEKAHDPTQLNKQGVDVGPQYRSAIFYEDNEQKKQAEEIIAKTNERKIYKKPIVTTLEPLVTFWEAEEYHQQYYEKYKEETGKTHIRVLIKKAKKKL